MDKSIKTLDKKDMKVQTRRYNSLVVEKLSTEHGFTKMYIRQCLSGDRDSLTADTIRKQYKELDKKVNEALNH
jgi:hypothetical protein